MQGQFDMVQLSTTFEHSSKVWAPTMRARRQIECPKEASGKVHSGTPFWFCTSVPQGGHNCTLHLMKRTVPGLVIEVPIVTNTIDIAKGDCITVWNPFPPQPAADDEDEPEEPAEAADGDTGGGGGEGGGGGKGKSKGKGGGKGKPKGKGVGDGDEQRAAKKPRKA